MNNLENEIWKDIPGYEGFYKASDLGRVKSLDRFIINKNGFKAFKKGKIMKPCISTTGYYYISLYRNNKGKKLKIHQIIALTFLNHKSSGFKKVIDHINNNPLDNRLCNLQIVSNRVNTSKDKKEGTSKYLGVHWHKHSSKWRSTIKIKGKSVFLGSFDNEYEAHLAYQEKLKRI